MRKIKRFQGLSSSSSSSSPSTALPPRVHVPPVVNVDYTRSLLHRLAVGVVVSLVILCARYWGFTKPHADEQLSVGELNAKLILLLQLQTDVCAQAAAFTTGSSSSSSSSSGTGGVLLRAIETRARKYRERFDRTDDDDDNGGEALSAVALFDEFVVGLHDVVAGLATEGEEDDDKGKSSSSLKMAFDKVQAEANALLHTQHVRDSVSVLRVPRRVDNDDDNDNDNDDDNKMPAAAAAVVQPKATPAATKPAAAAAATVDAYGVSIDDDDDDDTG